jgi:hypothetical protein
MERRARWFVLTICAVSVFAFFALPAYSVDCFLECETGPADPMPTPTGFYTPSIAYYEEPFMASWNHVWTGCGGYEFEYRQVGSADWTTIKVASGSSADIVIRRPDGDLNMPTSFELRVKTYWGVGCDERVYSDYSEVHGIEMDCGWLHCESSAQIPMPVPTNFSNPSEACFEEPFNSSWSHVWTGCGGYELEYRRLGTAAWTTVKVGSGSSADIVIRRPDEPINDSTPYELRVKSFWGVGCDERIYSEYSAQDVIEMRCSQPVGSSVSTWSCIKSKY